jgi:hypothetical protein
VKEAYRFLTTPEVPPDRSLVDNVWHHCIPSKVSLFVWRLLRNRLPTKDNLVRRRVLHSDDSACISGCQQSETANHLFLDCAIFGSLWHQVWNWLGISSVQPGDLKLHFHQFTNLPGLPRATSVFFKIIWFTSVWVIWKERNNRIFQNTVTNPSILIDKVKQQSFL